jgi:hypothetical protein
MDVDRAIDELYALPPEDFIAARDELVATARKAGDGKAAATIGKQRRPSRSAWVVNQLVRQRGEEVDQLLDLGDALRDAQQALAGDDLRRLSAQRRSVVSALARDARAVATELGQPVNEAVQREVEASLDAALADPTVAELVRSGRLTMALRHSGFGSGFGGGSEEGAVRTSATRPARKAPAGVDDTAELRNAVTAARAEVKEADKHERAEAAALTAASARREKTVRRVAQLEEDLAHARQEDSAAADEVRKAHRRHDTAAKSANAARQKQQRAEDALDKR